MAADKAYASKPRKFVIIGSSCSGKSTFARRIAAALKIAHIELDSLHWEPNWKEAEDAVFRERVIQAVSGETWVVDGNYGKVQDIVWTKADAVVWLDIPLATILWRFLVRSVSRSFSGEILWGGCPETLRNSIFSRNSLLVWILSTYSRRQKEFSQHMKNPPFPNLLFFRLQTEADISQFLEKYCGGAA